MNKAKFRIIILKINILVAFSPNKVIKRILFNSIIHKIIIVYFNRIIFNLISFIKMIINNKKINKFKMIKIININFFIKMINNQIIYLT